MPDSTIIKIDKVPVLDRGGGASAPTEGCHEYLRDPLRIQADRKPCDEQRTDP